MSFRFASYPLALIVSLLLLGGGRQAHALDYLDGKLQVHGFLSQGVVFTSDNNFLGESEDGSLDFREVGLNASWRPNADLQVAGQLLSHRAGESDDGDVQVDFALVDWTAISREWGRGGIRMGRVKVPYGLYNKTRDVAFTRPSIILPQSIYFERTRKVTIAADGLELYLEKYGEAGNLYVNYVAGWPDSSDKASEVAILGRDQAGNFSSDLTQLLQFMFEGSGGRYRLGITSVRHATNYRPGSSDPLHSGRFEFQPVIFSGQYNAEDWSVTAEYAVRPVRLSGFGVFPTVKMTGESYYLQGTYRLTPKVEALLRYDVAYSDRDDRDGSKFADSGPGRLAFTRYAKDWTLGLRYDVTPAFMVRAEYHNVDGTAWLTGLDNLAPSALERRWDMFMLLGSFRF